jgi:hypothetical protein
MDQYHGQFLFPNQLKYYDPIEPCEDCVKLPATDKCERCNLSYYIDDIDKYREQLKFQKGARSMVEFLMPYEHSLFWTNYDTFWLFQVYLYTRSQIFLKNPQMTYKGLLPPSILNIIGHYLTYYNPALDTRQYLINSNYKLAGMVPMRGNDRVLFWSDKYFTRVDYWQCQNCMHGYLFRPKNNQLVNDLEHEYIRREHAKKCELYKIGAITN